MGVYLLPNHDSCESDMGEHHHGNCKDGMMEHGESSDTEIENTVAFKAHKNCAEIQNTTDYLNPNQYKIKLSVKQTALIASFISINFELPEQEFFSTPEPRCNAGPPLPPNSLRGPPFV